MNCPDCNGTGKITLLTSVVTCKQCGGFKSLADYAQAVKRESDTGEQDPRLAGLVEDIVPFNATTPIAVNLPKIGDPYPGGRLDAIECKPDGTYQLTYSFTFDGVTTLRKDAHPSKE